MKPALLLIDLQNDYLAAAGLEPAGGAIVEGARELRAIFRGMPVMHIHTVVTRDPDTRMSHWKRAGRWICEAGTAGAASPVGPAQSEQVVTKRFFSAFENPRLDDLLREQGCDAVVLAGVHLHACVRAAALDAYARGYRVLIASDAVGSDDPLHAAITRRYLGARGAEFLSNREIAALLADRGAKEAAGGAPAAWRYQHRLPAEGTIAWEVRGDDVPGVARRAAEAWRAGTAGLAERVAGLRRMAEVLRGQERELSEMICRDVGKPIVMARGEVRRSAELLDVVAGEALRVPLEGAGGPGMAPGARWRRVPAGVVAVVTPWNNPLAIPVGKVAPALAYGCGVVWKPAPAGARIAQRVMELWRPHAGGQVHLALGGAAAAGALAGCAEIDAVTLSGSAAAGAALEELCLRRRIGYQAELGGNNGAIVCEDAEITTAAREIAAGALGFAGQRCTANRRVIVPAGMLARWRDALVSAMRALPMGDPERGETVIGPVISAEKGEQVRRIVERARQAGLEVIEADRPAGLAGAGAWCLPAVVICGDPAREIVQEESFGPIVVVQPAEDFEHALALLNGVRQGLMAALFSHDRARQERFLREARAGVLKLNQSTSNADAGSPFGGWKCSGMGPPEHGPADREFFTRWQAVYG